MRQHAQWQAPFAKLERDAVGDREGGGGVLDDTLVQGGRADTRRCSIAAPASTYGRAVYGGAGWRERRRLRGSARLACTGASRECKGLVHWRFSECLRCTAGEFKGKRTLTCAGSGRRGVAGSEGCGGEGSHACVCAVMSQRATARGGCGSKGTARRLLL